MPQNWKIGELLAALKDKNLEITEIPISAGNLSKLINLIKNDISLTSCVVYFNAFNPSIALW